MSDLLKILFQFLRPTEVSHGNSFTPRFTSSLPSYPVLEHSLANPLTSLHLSLETCLGEAQHTHPHLVPHLQEALASTKYVRQLLFAKGPHQLHFPEVIESVVTRLHQPQRGYFIHFANLTTRATVCQGNPILFQEALSCAIHNSWEAYRRGQSKTVVISLYQRQREVIIQITDFGQGMTWLTQRLVVSRGLSLKTQHRGLGTRFIKKAIEHSCRGQVIINSYWGVGTTHTWLLPFKRST